MQISNEQLWQIIQSLARDYQDISSRVFGLTVHLDALHNVLLNEKAFTPEKLKAEVLGLTEQLQKLEEDMIAESNAGSHAVKEIMEGISVG